MGTATRRDFLGKCGAGLAGILAAGKAPASIVKSLVAAKSEDFTKVSGEWVNPYVTNGLILHWDSIWNAGGGKHNNSASIWKDISGNGLDGLNVNPGRWTSDGYQCYDNYVHVESDLIQEALTNKSITCEIGILPRNRGSRPAIFGTQPTESAVDAGKSYMAYFISGDSNRASWLCWGGSYRIVFFPSQSMSTYSFPCNANVSQVYRNGIYYSKNTSGTSANTQSRRFKIGGIGTQGGMKCDLTYSFARLYNRSFSADEIAANYAIDKERFNIQ